MMAADQAPVAQRLDKPITGLITIQWIVRFVFVNTFPLDSDLTGG